MKTQMELQVADLLGADIPSTLRWEIGQRDGHILVSVGGRECQTAQLPLGSDAVDLALAVLDCQARFNAVCQAAFRARIGNRGVGLESMQSRAARADAEREHYEIPYSAGL